MTPPEPAGHRRARRWTLIPQGRAAPAADPAELPQEAWAAPSLCEGLTVREVLAHLTASARPSGPRRTAGGHPLPVDFDAQVAMGLAEQMGASGAATPDRLRAAVASTPSPPLPRSATLARQSSTGSASAARWASAPTAPTKH